MASVTMTTPIIPTVGSTAAVPGRRRRSLVVAAAGEPARQQGRPANADSAHGADGRRGVIFAAAGAAAAAALGRRQGPAIANAITLPDEELIANWQGRLEEDDPDVLAAARFAVGEHNRRTGRSLSLERVFYPLRTPTLAGFYYVMLVYTNDGRSSKTARYLAEVYRSTLVNPCFQLLFFNRG